MSRHIKHIVVHHTASPAKTTTWDMVDNWHRNQNGWKGIGYHYLILWSGLITVGRPENQIGAHLKGGNSDSIGVCVCGNFEIEQPLPAQLAALETILLDLLERHPEAELTYHRAEATTLCPGKNLVPHVRAIKDKVGR